MKKIAQLKTNKKTRGPAKNKSFKDYTNQHQCQIRKQLKEQCETALSFLGHYQFVPSRVELSNANIGEVESFSFIEDNEAAEQNEEEKEMEEVEISNLNMWLYLKDRFNISNEAWHELAMNSVEPPCLNKLIKHMSKLNTKWNLKPTPENTEGIQISFEKSLSEQIERLKNTGELKPGDIIKIKVSGDGTNVGKRLSVINVTYTILNEKQRAMSEKGNYLLAAIKEKES